MSDLSFEEWRTDIREWAASLGIPSGNGWMDDISEIALALGSGVKLAWRPAIRFIRITGCVPGTGCPIDPPDTPQFFIAVPPRRAGVDYLVLADGVIHADRVIMA